MFKKEEKNNTETSEETQEDTQEETQSSEPKEVKVFSKSLFNCKIVVIHKKIKPERGPERELFNVYFFNVDGETKMSERDAILFWKNRKTMKGMEDDVSVFSLNNEVEYDYEKVNNLYKVEKESLSNTQQPV